jgi:hypothetical protein
MAAQSDQRTDADDYYGSFGLLSFEGFDALLQKVDQPFEGFDALLLRVNGHDGLFEPFAQVLIRLVRLFQLFVFALQEFAQDYFLRSELFEFFILRYASTVANYAMVLQLHNPTEWLRNNYYRACCIIFRRIRSCVHSMV